MTEANAPKTLFYPKLGSLYDLWFVRISGSGMGNGFYNYFHAVLLAEKYGGEVITPPWGALKIRSLLQSGRGNRAYRNIFKPYSTEIYGVKKLLTMIKHFPERNIAVIDGEQEPHIERGKLNIVTSGKFTFAGLSGHRETIRDRLLKIINIPLPAGHSWGKGGFIGVHVRLGDFSATQNTAQITNSANTRISMSWYVNIIRSLQARYPDMPVRIFSDGSEEELVPLTSLGASIYYSGSDIGDLLALSSASILVGSNSTYSYWAAFLGGMPSIWLAGEIRSEQPFAYLSPIIFVPLDAADISLDRNFL